MRFLQFWLPWVIGVIFSLMILATAKLAVKRYTIQQEIQSQQRELAKAEARRQELTELLDYVQSPIYREEQARLKFGLAKPGEKVAVVPDIAEVNGLMNSRESVQDENGNDDAVRSNYKKWWDFFLSQVN